MALKYLYSSQNREHSKLIHSPGKIFRQILRKERPLQLIGITNALTALMAQEAGYKALYLSGAGVANSDLGLPDLGLTSLDDVLMLVRRITSRTTLPLIVDVDTGWGSPLNVYRTFFEISKAGAAGAHIEDQGILKRCGHRPGKKLVSIPNMVARIHAALEGRRDPAFVVIARTDAISVEGPKKALARAKAYEAAGADIIFVEAAIDLTTYKMFSEQLGVPILANITEFGCTPLFSLEELSIAGVSIALYPLTIFRSMNYAALHALKTLRSTGTQVSLLTMMQTRESLYQLLGYSNFEQALDHFLEGGPLKDEEK